MIRFPYGISDFHRIRSDHYLYLDRTAMISTLEEAGRQLIFLRPRRFGKSLLLSTLANYYDIKTADEFDALFADLAVGRQPTLEHNQYFILRWDFSKVSAQGDIEQIKRSLFQHINQAIKDFVRNYQSDLQFAVDTYDDDGIASFQSLVSVVHRSNHYLYLLIDEYDNFANDVLMQDASDKPRYLDLLQGEGILKTLFKVIKASASEGKISRVFITGVSPVVLSDMTSGYNVSRNISLASQFNGLCGIEQAELNYLADQVLEHCSQGDAQKAEVQLTLRQFYNGYRFCEQANQALIYNPTLCFYFLQDYQENAKPPRDILDGNLAMDAGRIRYISSLPQGQLVLDQILDEQHPLELQKLENQFGVEMLQRIQQDARYMVSLLYYFGVLTIHGVSALGNPVLSVPNLVIRGLYVESLKRQALPNPQDDLKVERLAEQFYQDADLQPLIEFMENKYFTVFSNRDYRWSNELTVKTAFLTLLFNDLFYIMDSESDLERRYSDLVMIIRPNARQYPTLKDFVFEFKYLTLEELKLTGESLRSQSREQLQQLAPVQSALQQASQQLAHYRQVLTEKYQQPQRLCCLAVVALGFERLVWQQF